MAQRESYLNMLHTSIRIPLRKLFTSNAAIKNSLNISTAVTTAITISAATTTAISISGAATTGLAITSTVAKGLDVTDATLTQGWNNGFFTCGSGNGSSGDQHSVTTTGMYIPIQVNMVSIANPTAVSHFTAAMFRTDVSTADQANTLCNPIAVRANIAKNIYGGAGINVDMEVSANITIGGESLKAGYFSLRGDGAITCTGDCNVLEATYRGTSGSSGIDNVAQFHMNAADCAVTNLLHLRRVQGTVSRGLYISGAMTEGIIVAATSIAKGIDFTDSTLTQGWNNGFFTCGSGNGSSGDQHSVTTTGFYIPIQVNMASIANPSAPSHFTCAMFRVDVSTADQANTLANPIAIRGDIAKNVYGIEGINCDIAITDAIDVTTGVNSGYFCLSGDGAITNTAENQVVLATYRGTSGSSGIDHVLAAHMNAPNCSVTNLLFLSNYQGTVTSAIKISGTATYLFDLSGVTSAENTVYEDDGAAATTIAGKLMIKDSTGAKGYINVYSVAN